MGSSLRHFDFNFRLPSDSLFLSLYDEQHRCDPALLSAHARKVHLQFLTVKDIARSSPAHRPHIARTSPTEKNGTARISRTQRERAISTFPFSLSRVAGDAVFLSGR